MARHNRDPFKEEAYHARWTCAVRNRCLQLGIAAWDGRLIEHYYKLGFDVDTAMTKYLELYEDGRLRTAH